MPINTSTLRPGLLVSVKTSVTGNVQYNKQDIEPDHYTGTGERKARWETERVISDPVEHEAAIKVRSKALSLIRSACSPTAFGFLCPEAQADKLEAALAEARRLTDAFNATAKLSRISVYVMTGRIAPDDVEAVKAINSEIRELMQDMEQGLRNLDVRTVRDAAKKARNVGAMLSPAAASRVSEAIEAARTAARKIVKAGEQGAVEIDLVTIRQIEEARTAFLDLDEENEIAAPQVDGRALDLAPEIEIGQPVEPVQNVEV